VIQLLKLSWGTVDEREAWQARAMAGRAPGGWMASSGRERRKYSRIATDQVISFAEVDHLDQLAVGKNLSSGGIRFEAVGCEINLGDTLRVTFNVGVETVIATGLVVWATETDAFSIDVGLEFLEIDPSAVDLLDSYAGGIEA
jgi:hypothetical protein